MTEQQLAEVRQLSEWLAGTDITLLELSGPGKTIRLRRGGLAGGSQPVPPVQAPPEPVASTSTVVRADSVGIVLHAHPMRAEPLVRPGQEVAAGQPLALLRIGLLLLPVPAPRAGKVGRMVAADGATVGFGDALVELE